MQLEQRKPPPAEPGHTLLTHAPGAMPRPAGERYYRPELDWLRFMAFSMVFLMHACPAQPEKYTSLGVPDFLARYAITPIIQAGGYGVDLFFTLSSFLITELLLREKDATGRVHIKAFYLRRILRIWPLYLAFLMLAAPYELIMKDIPVTFYVFMLTFIGNWHVFVFGGVRTICGNLWTVCVEEQFYITWPNLVARATFKRFFAILLAMWAFTCLYRIVYVYTFPPSPILVWYNTFTRLDGFAVGGLLACALHGRRIVWPFAARAGAFLIGIAIIWVIGNVPIAGFFGEYPAWTYPLVAVASGLFIAAFATSTTRTSLNMPMRALCYLGKISYGLYVFHGPALLLYEHWFGLQWPNREWHWVFRVTFAAFVTLSASMLSYAWLERPFLNLKRRFTFIASRPT